MSPPARLRQGTFEGGWFNRKRQQLRVSIESAPFLCDHAADHRGTVQRLVLMQRQDGFETEGTARFLALRVDVVVLRVHASNRGQGFLVVNLRHSRTVTNRSRLDGRFAHRHRRKAALPPQHPVAKSPVYLLLLNTVAAGALPLLAVYPGLSSAAPAGATEHSPAGNPPPAPSTFCLRDKIPPDSPAPRPPDSDPARV